MSDENTFRQIAWFVGVLLVFAIGIAVFAYTASVLMIAFAGILFAVFLNAISRFASGRMGTSYSSTVILITIGLLGGVILAGSLLAPSISSQAGQLTETLPQSLETLREALPAWLTEFAQPGDFSQIMEGSLFANATTVVLSALGAIGTFLVVLATGVFLAFNPAQYRKGFECLFPPPARPRVHAVLSASSHDLRRWLIGQAVGMILVGLVTGIGLALIGVPFALTLGIIAGLLEFIPYFGPIVAGVLAVLIAFTVSPATAAYTAIFFLAIQALESNLVMPLIQYRAVHIPPALLLLWQLFMGALLGIYGIILATPLLVVLMVLVSNLYVKDVLHEE